MNELKTKLEELLSEAKVCKEKNLVEKTIPYMYGVEYEKWLEHSRAFVLQNFSNDEDGKKFLKESIGANGNKVQVFENLVVLLQSIYCKLS